MANLAEMDNRITVDSLQTAVGYEFLRTAALSLQDGGTSQISKQRGFQYINPTDDWFPGKLKQLQDQWNIQNQNWIAYNKYKLIYVNN